MNFIQCDTIKSKRRHLLGNNAAIVVMPVTLCLFTYDHSVESLAEQIRVSRVHLYRKISELTGMSVNELIRKLRLHRAAQLLEQRWGPVSQVAYEIGFSNLSYFSKVFKEEFGELPSDYIVKINKPS